MTSATSAGPNISHYMQQLKNVGFNGPYPYKILSDDAKVWIEGNPAAIRIHQSKPEYRYY